MMRQLGRRCVTAAVAFRGGGGSGVLVHWVSELRWTSLQLGVEDAGAEEVGGELPMARWSRQRWQHTTGSLRSLLAEGKGYMMFATQHTSPWK
jgi:hypothetical protein